MRRFRASDGEALRIQQADLNENRCLIPVDVFVYQLVATELHDCYQRNLDLTAGWRDAGQHPVDLGRMREREQYFIDQAVLADGPADQLHGGIRRIRTNKVIFIKTFELIMTDAARHRRNMVDIRLRD